MRDYLSVGRQIISSNGYSRVIKSLLQKKVQLFIKQELPLLIEKGLVMEFRNVTEKIVTP
jgi:hypothetical protein